MLKVMERDPAGFFCVFFKALTQLLRVPSSGSPLTWRISALPLMTALHAHCHLRQSPFVACREQRAARGPIARLSEALVHGGVSAVIWADVLTFSLEECTSQLEKEGETGRCE